MKMTIEKAQRLIGGILSELEKDTGSIVKRLDLVDTETTGFTDARRQMQRHVEVYLERLPGTSWVK